MQSSDTKIDIESKRQIELDNNGSQTGRLLVVKVADYKLKLTHDRQAAQEYVIQSCIKICYWSAELSPVLIQISIG